jgi:hypothetical protein
MAIKVKGFFLVQKRSLSSPVGGVHWDGRGEIRSPPPVVQIGTKICVVGTGIRVAAADGITGGVAVTSLGITVAHRVQEIFNKNKNNPAHIIRIDVIFISWPPTLWEQETHIQWINLLYMVFDIYTLKSEETLKRDPKGLIDL